MSRDELEAQFKGLLSLMGPTAEFLAQMPVIAAREWEARKGRIAKDSEVLSRRLAEQTTLNQKLIRAKLQAEISDEDFQTFKASITAETARINEQIIALDAERSTMQDLCQQAEVQTLDLVLAWQRANANQRQELVRGLFPEGLHFSHEKKFFEPANTVIRDMQLRWLEKFLAGKDDFSLVGVPDGILTRVTAVKAGSQTGNIRNYRTGRTGWRSKNRKKQLNVSPMCPRHKSGIAKSSGSSISQCKAPEHGVIASAKRLERATSPVTGAERRNHSLRIIAANVFILHANANTQNKDGLTALINSVSPDVARVFVENGADLYLRDKEGKTALEEAKRFNRPDKAAVLGKL